MGMPILTDIPQHGHSNAFDGGVLKQTKCIVRTSGGVGFSGPGLTTSIAFDAEDFDPVGIHSTTVNNTRFTVPFGYNFALVGCMFQFTGQVASSTFMTATRLNGVTVGQTFRREVPGVAQSHAFFVQYPMLAVVIGNYIEVRVGMLAAVNGSLETQTTCVVELFR